MKKQFDVIDSRLSNIESLLLDLKDATCTGAATSSNSRTERNYLDSIVQLSDFLGCHNSAAKRLKLAGRIKFTQEGTRVRFYIPDVLYAIATDPVVARHFSKAWNPITSAKPVVPPVPPKIYVETELYPGRYIFAKLRYQKWSCSICIPEHLWNDANKVADFINQVIIERHLRFPFPIPPVINNQ